MTGFLDETWPQGVDLAATHDRAHGTDGQEGGGAPAVLVRRVVTGGPDGDVTLEALLPRTGPGHGDGDGTGEPATLTFTTTHAVATELDAGDVSPAVAYMQGRLKAEGDMPTLYALLAATRT